MKPLQLYLCLGAGLCVCLGLIYWRERSWNAHSQALQSKLDAETFHFESAMLLLQVQQLHNLQPVISPDCFLPDGTVSSKDECLSSSFVKPSALVEGGSNGTTTDRINNFIASHSADRIGAFFKEMESLHGTGTSFLALSFQKVSYCL
jgi:hypothetical protein